MAEVDAPLGRSACDELRAPRRIGWPLCYLLAVNVGLLCHVLYGVACQAMVDRCPRDCFMSNRFENVVVQEDRDFAAAATGCDERILPDGYAGCQDHAFSGNRCLPWNISGHHSGTTLLGVLEENYCRSSTTFWESWNFRHVDIGGFGCYTATGPDRALPFEPLHDHVHMPPSPGSVVFELCTSRAVRSEGRVGTVVRDERPDSQLVEVLWRDGTQESMHAGKLEWVGSGGPCGFWCRFRSNDKEDARHVCSWAGERRYASEEFVAVVRFVFVLLSVVNGLLCIPFFAIWARSARSWCARIVPIGTGHGNHNRQTLRQRCCKYIPSLRAAPHEIAAALSRHCAWITLRRYSADVRGTFKAARVSSALSMCSMISKVFIAIAFTTVIDRIRKMDKLSSESMSEQFWRDRYSSEVLFYGDAEILEILLFMPPLLITAFCPDLLTCGVLDGCSILLAGMRVWRVVFSYSHNASRSKDHIYHQSAFVLSTLAFGNAPLLVCLYSFVWVFDSAMRSIFWDVYHWHDYTEVLGAFGFLAGAMLHVERLKWQAHAAHTASEKLVIAFKNALSPVCDFVLHLNCKFELVEPCPRLGTILLSVGRFSREDTLRPAFSNTDLYNELLHKFGTMGTQPAEIVDMIDFHGTTVRVRLTITTFEDAHGARQVIIFGSEMGERDHTAPLPDTTYGPPRGSWANDFVEDIEESSDSAISGRSMSTAQVFHRLTRANAKESAMRGVLSLGLSEQWLVPQADVTLFPDMQLGKGGFGTVQGGMVNGTPVVVKFASGISSIQSRACLCNELRILRQLRHPRVVLFFGAIVDASSGQLALVLEHIGGKQMLDYVQCFKGQLPGTDQQSLCEGVCHALWYLHTREVPVVHGDLKPENVMVCDVDGCPTPKLLDFGLSRLLAGNVRPLGGTSQWMAPEVRLAGSPSVSADIFSFGRMLYFVTTKQIPRAKMASPEAVRLARTGLGPDLAWPENISCAHSSMTNARELCQWCCAAASHARPTAQDVHVHLRAKPLRLEPRPPGERTGISFQEALSMMVPAAERRRTALSETFSNFDQLESTPSHSSEKADKKSEQLEKTEAGALSTPIGKCLLSA